MKGLRCRQDRSLAKLAGVIQYIFDPTAGNKSVNLDRIELNRLANSFEDKPDTWKVQIVLDVAVASGLVLRTDEKTVYTWNGKEDICHHFKKIQGSWFDGELSKIGHVCQVIIAMLLKESREEIPLDDIADQLSVFYSNKKISTLSSV